MLRYARVYKTFFLSAFVREMEFRANFFAKVIQNLVWMFFFVAILLVIYGNTKQVAGWSRSDAFVLAATCFLLQALMMAFFMSLMELPSHVRLGTLDYVITKPIDSQFWISARMFNFDQIGVLVAGFAMLLIGAGSLQKPVFPAQWVGYFVLLGAALAIFYSFNLILMTTAIWFVRVDNLWVLGQSILDVARFPIDIYNIFVQRFFIYFVPMAFLATIPARQLVLGFDGRMVVVGLLWAVAFLAGSRLFWRYAVRNYASASS